MAFSLVAKFVSNSLSLRKKKYVCNSEAKNVRKCQSGNRSNS